MKKVYLLSHPNMGCGSFIADNTLIRKYLKENDVYTDSIDKADCIIIYTCAAGEEVENDAIKLIDYAKNNKKKFANIIVTGCLPSINKERLKRVFSGINFSSLHLDEIDSIFALDIPISKIKYFGSKKYKKSNKYNAYALRIGWGCVGKCTYCGIKNVFGGIKSRDMDDILEEFRIALGKGYKVFRIVSNEIGAYGIDKNKNADFPFLIRSIANNNGKFKLGLESLAPDKFKLFLKTIAEFVQKNKIPFIYSPVQSGSNKMLKLMNRNYAVEEFKECVKGIRGVNKKIILKTDLMVGFPQETEKDFLKTLKLISWLSSYNVIIKIYNFSVRPDTKAERMHGKIAPSIIDNRMKRAFQSYQINQAIDVYIKKFRKDDSLLLYDELGKFVYQNL